MSFSAPNLLPCEGDLAYWPDFLPAAQTWYEGLLEEVAWQRDTIRIFGKTHWQPRLLAWYGEASYAYSGRSYAPQAPGPLLARLRAEVEAFAGHRFNGILLNYYRDGQDHMGWHADDEPSLDPQAPIFALSLGQVRDFALRHKRDKSLKMKLALASGSLLAMSAEMQRHWQHALPKRAGGLAGRISLTFRVLL